MTFPEALDYLDSFLNYEQVTAYRYPADFSLDRVERFLERLGRPHRRYPSLHVAGTKGKGSTCAFAASILHAGGLKTGLYTSPHLLDFRERIRIDGQPISEEEFAEIVERIRPVADRNLTFFEVTTACAFLCFSRSNVDVAVVEVGMGGRLDATNVLHPEVTAITPIGLDHVPKLGGTVEEIAREKAGIIKPAVPVAAGIQRPQALRVVEQAARAQKASLHRVDLEVRGEIHRLAQEGTRASFQTPVASYPNVWIPLAGRHQWDNAAVALRMVELFAESASWRIPSESVRRGLAQTSWPGRCQCVEAAGLTMLLDGAQNADSAQALRRTVETLFPNRSVWLMVGTSVEKDVLGMAREWEGWADRVIVTCAQSPRAESPGRLASLLSRCGSVLRQIPSVPESLQWIKTEADPTTLVVVTGSLFVVGEALRWAQDRSRVALSAALPSEIA